MTRYPASATRPGKEAIACDIPPDLRHADDLLMRYGIWCTTASSRGGKSGGVTLDRMYERETNRKDTLAEFFARREAAYAEATREVLMPTPEAMLVQQALGYVPDRERIVLSILYVPKWRYTSHEQLEALRITPALARIRHLQGLRCFAEMYALVCHLPHG